MSDLIEFLRARLDEDEQIARAAAVREPDRISDGEPEPYWAVLYADDYEGGINIISDSSAAGRDNELDQWLTERLMNEQRTPGTDHIMRHDPARVLAEVEAKRRIIAKFEHFNDRDDMPQAVLTLEWTLRVLAQPYADHPDYDPAWRI